MESGQFSKIILSLIFVLVACQVVFYFFVNWHSSKTDIVDEVMAKEEVAPTKSTNLKLKANISDIIPHTIPTTSGSPKTKDFSKCNFDTDLEPILAPVVFSEIKVYDAFEKQGFKFQKVVADQLLFGGYQVISKTNAVNFSIPTNVFLSDTSSEFEARNNSNYFGLYSRTLDTLRIFDPHCRLIDEVDLTTFKDEGVYLRKPDLTWVKKVVASEPGISSPTTTNPETETSPNNITISKTAADLESPSTNSSLEHIVIRAVQASSEVGGNYDEFVKLYNPNIVPVNLEGYTLKKQTTSGKEYVLVGKESFLGIIQAHGEFLITHSGYKGGDRVDLHYSTKNSLAKEANSVLLYDASGTLNFKWSY